MLMISITWTFIDVAIFRNIKGSGTIFTAKFCFDFRRSEVCSGTASTGLRTTPDCPFFPFTINYLDE